MYKIKMVCGTISSVLCLCLLQAFPPSSSAVDTTKLTVSTLKDAIGNSADKNSDITYRAIGDQPARPTKCSNCIGDGGIRPFYDSAKSFSHLMASSEYPYDIVDKLYGGRTSEVTDDYEKLIKDNMGFVICVAIGFLFVIIFPIVGCVFGCCRCCGKCGGSRRTDGLTRKGYARPCLSVSLAILSMFVIAGGAMLFKANDAISDGLNSVGDDWPANLDTLKDYFNDTTQVIDKIATADLDFTRSVVFRDLDNIGYLFGGAVRDNLRKETKTYMDRISSSVETMDQALSKLSGQLPDLNAKIKDVKDKVQKYASAVNQITKDYSTAMATAGSPVSPPDINTKIDDTQLADFDGATELGKVGNLSKKLEESQAEIDNIPEKVQNDSLTQVSDLKSSIMDYTSTVSDNTEDLDFADRIDTDDIKDKITEYADKAVKYDEYRKYGGQGLAAVILLIALLMLMGLLLGVCGSSGSTLPHQRGGASNCGGNILIAAVALTFLFGSLLMLITTVMFLVGVPAEGYVCDALEDTTILDKLINDYELVGSIDGKGTYLGDKILDDPDKNMTLTEVLSACKRNEAMYKAFRVNESDFFNITEVLDYKSKFSVEEDISKINVDFSKITVLTPSLKANLKDLNDSIQYDFKTYDTELNKNPTAEADKFLTSLEAKLGALPGAQKTATQTAIDSLKQVGNTEGKALKDSVDALKTQMNDLKDTLEPAGKPSLSDEITSMQDAMSDLDANLGSAGDKSFNQSLEYFTNRTFGIVDKFIDRLLYALDHDIGKCGPVWNTYSGIFIDSYCGTIVASLNGFWFALGWSLFFLMPSIIVAVKLAGHFRRMRLDDSSQKFLDPDISEMAIIPDSKAPPKFANKVAPYDRYQEPGQMYW